MLRKQQSAISYQLLALLPYKKEKKAIDKFPRIKSMGEKSPSLNLNSLSSHIYISFHIVENVVEVKLMLASLIQKLNASVLLTEKLTVNS
ncbi:hypothetical protein CYANOKiyG1_12870 [Okeania sp. KiyG1]|nr:hypothetical protein CYANOKiyG1_12870 [Okeania sp. KiyG1]